MLDHSANPGRHSLAVRKDDHYDTPAVAVRALLAAEDLPAVVWEPACGPGNIVRVLRESGRKVYATDLVDYGCPESEHGVDFLMESSVPAGTGAIVTNPPFKLAEQFIKRALELCPRVIMLHRLAFLESERRSAILDSGQFARVYIFRNRLPMMHRDNWNGPRIKGGSVAFAWFVWDRFHAGPAQLHRISWAQP
jgi:hypothetical protein